MLAIRLRLRFTIVFYHFYLRLRVTIRYVSNTNKISERRHRLVNSAKSFDNWQSTIDKYQSHITEHLSIIVTKENNW